MERGSEIASMKRKGFVDEKVERMDAGWALVRIRRDKPALFASTTYPNSPYLTLPEPESPLLPALPAA